MKRFKMSKTEFLKRKISELLRFIPFYSNYENEILTDEFRQTVRDIKEQNSQIVFEAYYLPKAISAILKEDGYLTTPQGAYPRATAMMLSDMAQGVLNEFYKFKS